MRSAHTPVVHKIPNPGLLVKSTLPPRFTACNDASNTHGHPQYYRLSEPAEPEPAEPEPFSGLVRSITSRLPSILFCCRVYCADQASRPRLPLPGAMTCEPIFPTLANRWTTCINVRSERKPHKKTTTVHRFAQGWYNRTIKSRSGW